jgi:acetyl-CoA carboxylase biotin carboxyl carrier protein
MKLSGNDILQILKTLDELGYRRFYLEHGDLKLEVDSEGGGTVPQPPSASTAAMPAAPQAAPQGAPEPAAEPVPGPAPPAPFSVEPPREGLIAVTAPMTGTFYRAPAPDAPPFVEAGDAVEAAQTVCIVEVMKLFNSIAAGVAGTVVEVCVDNESPVAAGQPMVWIEPS